MDRPLSGIRVVALEQYMAGPYCSMLLADAGAEVIKIERPGLGDPRRSIPPFAEKDGIKKAGGFMAYNRNKKSVCLNVRSEEGKQVYYDLIKASDAVVENIRPGSTDKMGIGYNDLKELNPKLIYAAISGFGRLEGYQGPDSNRPAFDIVAEAMSGIMHSVGFDDKPPSWTIYGMADIYTGLCTSYAITQALLQRERTGKGQFVDSSMLDAMISLNERMVMLYTMTGEEPHRGRLKHLYPRAAFKCKDGYIAMNVPDDRVWARLCGIIDRPDLVEDERSKTGTARAANIEFLNPIIENWLLEKTRSEAETILNNNGVPVGPVNTAKDVFESEQVKARKSLVEIDDPDVGTNQFARGPVMLSGSPEIETNPAPDLGEHTRKVLSDILRYSENKIEKLLQSNTIEIPT
jgi:formyl-CoA transferase